MSGVAASSLAVLAPVKSGREVAVSSAIATLGDGDRSPFARVPGTHFARFAFVPALTGPGGAKLTDEGAFLLMCADFDQTVGQWSATLCDRVGEELFAVLGNCDGFPDVGDPGAVARFFTAHDVRAGFTVAGYRRCTVEEVREALRLQRALRALAVMSDRDDLDPAALRAEWRRSVDP